jgi:hypothetical protein
MAPRFFGMALAAVGMYLLSGVGLRNGEVNWPITVASLVPIVLGSGLAFPDRVWPYLATLVSRWRGKNGSPPQ